MAQDDPVDPIHGKPMSQNMRYLLWALLATLSIGGMTLVTCQWRQKKQEIEQRTPKIDRSSEARNKVNAATPPSKPTFSKGKAAGQGPGGR